MQPIKEMIEPNPSFGYRTVAYESALEQALISRFGTLGRVPAPFLLRSDNGLVSTSHAHRSMCRPDLQSPGLRATPAASLTLPSGSGQSKPLPARYLGIVDQMTSVTLSSGKCFQASPGQSILDAALKAQIVLPYSCATGRCAACRCKVIDGTTRELLPETGLSEQDKADGWILACARSAESQTRIEIEELRHVGLPLARTWPCRISDIKRLAPDVLRVQLRLPPTAEFRFIAGQHVTLIGPQGIRRSYSLARANFVEQLLELHIREVPGGAMSDYWFRQAQVNDLLRLNGPLGTFFLREAAGIDLIFLATGTGMAPIKAMLESLTTLSSPQQPRSVRVLWGGRHPEDHYLATSDLPDAYPYLPVLSRPAGAATGATGYIQDVLLRAMPDLTLAAVYACGSDAMIQAARARLAAAGLQAGAFHAEAFVRSGTT